MIIGAIDDERGGRTMSDEVSTLRLYLMRLVYLLNFVLLGLDVWPGLINHVGAWDPVKGVAFSFWAALSVLSGLGLRYPLRMLPLLLLQLVYKSKSELRSRRGPPADQQISPCPLLSGLCWILLLFLGPMFSRIT